MRHAVTSGFAVMRAKGGTMTPAQGNGAIDLLFDVRHIDQSGIGTYIGVYIPRLEEALARQGRYTSRSVPSCFDRVGVD